VLKSEPKKAAKKRAGKNRSNHAPTRAMDASNPYKPPESTEPPPTAPVALRVIPFWVMRIIFVLSAAILFADAYTRGRPELRPDWLGTICVGFEVLLASIFAMLAFVKYLPPAAGPTKPN
jgi:hypothetical protein